MQIKYGRLQDEVVVEVVFSDDMESRYHPSIAWIEIPDEVGTGWTFREGQFSPPEEKAPTPDRLSELEQLVADLTELVLLGGGI